MNRDVTEITISLATALSVWVAYGKGKMDYSAEGSKHKTECCKFPRNYNLIYRPLKLYVPICTVHCCLKWSITTAILQLQTLIDMIETCVGTALQQIKHVWSNAFA
jgi:hypothetical protein